MTDLLQGATSIRFYQRIRTRRLLAMLAALAFAWTFILATPAQTAASVGAQNALHKRARIGGPRWLTRRQMEMHTGRLHQLAVSEMSGGSFGWEASVGSDNTATGNKLTAIPIVGWTNRGGMAVNFTLSHSSESTHNSETTSLTLDNAGRVTRTDFSNTTYTLTSYDSANRTTEIQTKNSGGTKLSDIQYSYDSASNVSTRTDTDGTVTSFGYDSSDQLTSESRDNSHSTGYSISYTYDHNQNRATKVQGGVTDTYSYSSHDHLTSTSSKSFTYDSNGNCTAVTVGGNTTSLTWDDSNRCSGITYPNSSTNSFSYNGEDLRVSKVDSAGTTNSITDGTSPASPVLKDSRAVYTPGISERASSTSKWYHGDALGSTRGITNGSQTVTDTMLYDAFGMMVTRTGTTASPFGFVGAAQYQSDADSGLQLLGHRMYDPSIGRFISSDPAKDGLNWYSYCDNAPAVLVDPSGCVPKLEGFRRVVNFVKVIVVIVHPTMPTGPPVYTPPDSQIVQPVRPPKRPYVPPSIGGGGGSGGGDGGGGGGGGEGGGGGGGAPGRGSLFRLLTERESGSGGGLAAPGTILEGAGALAGGMDPVLKWKSYIKSGYDQVDDWSPEADPGAQATWRANVKIL